MKKALLFVALAGLAACSGTPKVSPPLPPVPGQSLGNGTNLTGTVPSGGAVGSTITTILDGTTAITGVTKLAISGNYGQAGRKADTTTFDVVGFSDDGIAFTGQPGIIKATTIGCTSAVCGSFGQIARWDRAAGSVLPTVGGGTFTGQYRGTYGSDTAGAFGNASGKLIATTGTVTLTANFGASTPYISGTILNHNSLLADGTSPDNLGNVTLTQTNITSNGTFSGTASSASASGTFKGLIGGPNGTGVAGGLLLNGPATFTEVGVFTGTRP
jgi:hypothetical protein